MKMKKALAMALALIMMVGALAGCGPKFVLSPEALNLGASGVGAYDNPDLPYAAGTTLRMAVGYNSRSTGLFFDSDTAKDGITLADGKTYMNGSLKPTWVEVQNQLNIVFEDKYQGQSASKEFEYWQNQLDQVDFVPGNATTLSRFGGQGQLVNIADYLDKMPNFKAYLDANPIVRMSITGDDKTGAIYFSPYFDGVNDIERMPLMRTDWVEKLLDSPEDDPSKPFSAASSDNTPTPVYKPYLTGVDQIEVNVVKADGSGVESITKDYKAAGGNIVEIMNAKGSMSGVDAVNTLRKYIDEAYGGYYGAKRSDLFVGQNAAWDADELVALLRCIVANSATLNADGEKVQGIFCREDSNNQRRVDMVHLAGILFGVRGLESRKDYLYVGTDNLLHDARQEPETYVALDRMNAMAKEGLIAQGYMSNGETKTEDYLKYDRGFMHYDYNQTQTIYNEDGTTFAQGEQYMAAMPPVACWYDGTNVDKDGVDHGNYMRFTESWRSVKTDGWAISVAGIAGDENKLNAALALIDYAYTDEGMILLSYGPKEFRGKIKFSFNGEKMPTISDECRAELWEKADGNYTNYARKYLGSTLSFVKCQSFEYQCTTQVGREGAGYISKAIALGTIKHPELDVTSNPWYTSVPTILPTTDVENDEIVGYTNLGDTVFGSSKDQRNLLVDVITKGYVDANISDAASAAKVVQTDYYGKQYLETLNKGWTRALALYDGMKESNQQ